MIYTSTVPNCLSISRMMSPFSPISSNDFISQLGSYLRRKILAYRPVFEELMKFNAACQPELMTGIEQMSKGLKN